MNPPISFTPTTRVLLGGLFAIYVVQLVLRGTLEPWLAWQPLGGGFLPWQVFSAFLLNGEPINTIFDWMILFFTVPTLERDLGRRRLGNAMMTAWAFAVVATLGLSALGVVSGTFVGLTPLVGALIALFGFLHPDARILLFFVIPIRAGILAWGTGLVTFLYMLFARDLGSTLGFFAWVGVYFWMRWGDGLLRRLTLRVRRQQAARKVGRLEVFEGGRGRGRENDWVN